MTRDDLVAAALLKYPFRRREWNEPAGAYLAAVIAHVKARDWAAAHELAVGRPQAEWTRADVEAFRREREAKYRWPSERSVQPDFTMTLPHRYPTTEAGLRTVATRGMEGYIRLRREKDADVNLVPIVNVLLTSGEVRICSTARDDRIAVLKWLAREEPVFGYILLADVFIHGIAADDASASRQDALLAHLGTRELRLVWTRPYVWRGRRLEVAPLREIDLRKEGPNAVDPYAGIFVSVPTTGRG